MQKYEQQPSQSSSEEEVQIVNSSEQQIAKKNIKAKKKSKNTYRIVLNISDCQYAVVTRVAKDLGWKLQSSSQATDWDVFWTDNAVQPQVLAKMEPHQKINHFPGMFNLARKNLLGRGLMRLRKKFPQQYNFFPMTWMLPVEYHQLKAYFQTKQKGKARTFIVKPEALSQGKGIYLTRKIQDIDPHQHCVVQKYLHKPYLIDGLKFDLRIYVLLAGVDPLRLYIFNEGLGRFATEKYEQPTKQNMQDTCMHLTNYAINKDNPKFIFNKTDKDMSKGHKRSLTSVIELLKEQSIDTERLWIKIKECIIKSILSGLPILKSTYRACQAQNYASDMCFQLLGFDVMLTDKCEPVLLQINHTPSFSTDTPLDNLIKFNYIKDSLVLMNINQRKRNAVVKARKQACQQRIITGKKIKFSQQQRESLKKQEQRIRDKYEKKNIGGFQLIYPCEDQKRMEIYSQIIDFADQHYQVATGNKKLVKTPIPASKQKQVLKSKTVSTGRKPTFDFVKANMNLQRRFCTKNAQYRFESNKQLSRTNKEAQGLQQNSLQKERQLISESNEEKDQHLQIFPADNRVQNLKINHRSYNTITNSQNNLKSAKTAAQIPLNNPFSEPNFWVDQELDSQKNMQNIGNNIPVNIPKRINNVYTSNIIKYPSNIRFYQQKPQSGNPLKSNLLRMSNNQNKVLLRQTTTQYNTSESKRNIVWKKEKSNQPRALSTQQSKIPIALNTLLISGFQPTSSVSINNLKKILNQQKHKNHQ